MALAKGRADSGMVRERSELSGRTVVRVDTAGLYVIDPSVQCEAPFFERETNGRMSADVRQLRDHVLAAHRVESIVLALVRACPVRDTRGIGVAQPVANGRQVLHALAGRNRGHRTEIGVSADHDV